MERGIRSTFVRSKDYIKISENAYVGALNVNEDFPGLPSTYVVIFPMDKNESHVG